MTNNDKNSADELIIGAKGNKKGFIKLMSASFAIAAAVIGIGCAFVPLGYLFGSDGYAEALRRLLMVLILSLATAAAYDGLRLALTAFKGFGVTEHKKPWFFLAGCEKTLKPKEYALVNLLPAAGLLLIFTVLLIILPKRLFWVVYIMQDINLAITVLPVYVLIKAGKMKKKTGRALIEDTGGIIRIWAKKR